jgi:hypothetical protein
MEEASDLCRETKEVTTDSSMEQGPGVDFDRRMRKRATAEAHRGTTR